MNKIKNFIKLSIIKILRIFLKLFFIFPIKNNAILFCAFEGKQYSCNPKYLYEYIRENFGTSYKYVWVMNNKNNMPDKDVVCVKYLSFKHVFYHLTCKYCISNYGTIPFIPKRKNQVFLNTWHGSGAYKSQTLEQKYLYNKVLLNNRDYRARITDLYVSGCEMYSKVSAESWNVDIEKFISCGTPRNDIFFKEFNDSVRIKYLEKIKLDKDYAYVLYAPTYRGHSFRKHDGIAFEIDFDSILDKLEKKFNKKFKVLYREHLGADGINHSSEKIIDVYDYPDIQELMLISDVLITDYSSNLWDFSFLNRPGFLYTPDLDDYLSERSFYTDISTWAFPYAKTMNDFLKLIDDYTEEGNLKKIQQHHEYLGNYESGCASKTIVEKMGIN